MTILTLYLGCSLAGAALALWRPPRMPRYWLLLAIAAVPQLGSLLGIWIAGHVPGVGHRDLDLVPMQSRNRRHPSRGGGRDHEPAGHGLPRRRDADPRRRRWRRSATRSHPARC